MITMPLNEYRQKNKKKQSKKRCADPVNEQSVFNCQQLTPTNELVACHQLADEEI